MKSRKPEEEEKDEEETPHQKMKKDRLVQSLLGTNLDKNTVRGSAKVLGTVLECIPGKEIRTFREEKWGKWGLGARGSEETIPNSILKKRSEDEPVFDKEKTNATA